MGMTNNQLMLIRAIAENRHDELKKIALSCCSEDTTKKNEYAIKRYISLLKAENTTLLKLPPTLSSICVLEDVSSFDESRYYLSEEEAALFDEISKMNNTGFKLLELGIPYVNSTLLTGDSGTGKTMFGRFVAYKLGLPFLYINFSYLIDSYMGKTSRNLHSIFDFVRQNKCLLMLDEIDAIAQQRRGSSEGSTREYNNTTITLLQELDNIKNDTVVIAATNIPSSIDTAVKRRFAVHHEMSFLDNDDIKAFAVQYLNTLSGYSYSHDNIEKYADKMTGKPQSEIVKGIIQAVADAISENKTEIILS